MDSLTRSRNGESRAAPPAPSAQDLLGDLLASSLVLCEDWYALPAAVRDEIARTECRDAMLDRLVEYGLLTNYQAARIEAGTTFGLILGSYRVLDRLGAGGMGVVFRGEHGRMRRQVAIKVLPLGPDQDSRLLDRFLSEIRIVSQLQHPNIVAAFDAGEALDPHGSGPVLHFFVMEYVPGRDLEEVIRADGPLPVANAADLIHQVASALAEAHTRTLVHRDIKPSNILVTPQGQAKLLDFGLARNFDRTVTEPGVLLGTFEYMAPEQIEDAHAVDIRADLYALGGTLYWCLTGEPPFSSTGHLLRDLSARMSSPPPSLRARRPEAPVELDAVVQRLLATKPEDRYGDPQAVMHALWPFLSDPLHSPIRLLSGHRLNGAPLNLTPNGDGADLPLHANGSANGTHSAHDDGVLQPPRAARVLVIDDDADFRQFIRHALQADALHCDLAAGGVEGLCTFQAKSYDLVLLDMNMPDMTGTEVCRNLRALPQGSRAKIIMVSGDAGPDALAQMLHGLADDFITKPFSVGHLRGRVQAALRLKDAQDRAAVLQNRLMVGAAELERSLASRDGNLVQTRNALVLALGKLAELRVSENGQRLVRMQEYVRALAEEAGRSTPYADVITPSFIDLLVCCVPLHDIGKVGLPDHIVLKPGKLDADERILMQAHTSLGAETLEVAARNQAGTLPFLKMAMEIVRSHHERWDGRGYPDRLAGARIPLPARLVALCDVYDALRSRRVYKPALSHPAALQVMLEGSPGQFDPDLLPAFQRCGPRFEEIFREVPD